MDKYSWKSTLVGTAFTGLVLLSTNVSADALQFKFPGDPAPKTSVGGGARGRVRFALPDQSNKPTTSIGGGTRGQVKFALPGQTKKPKTSIGGGTRGKVKFTFPGQTKKPRTSVGASTRGSNFSLRALLPTTNHGRTISARPTIFTYLPPIGAEEVFFSLQDKEGHPHYDTMLKVPVDGGIIGVTLPQTASELQVGKDYLWYFAPIGPSGILRPDNLAVTGWVKRVAFNLDQEVVSPLQLAIEYAGAGIWYDTLEVLAQAQQSEPQNTIIKTEWHDLLAQIGLAKISAEPITIVSAP